MAKAKRSRTVDDSSDDEGYLEKDVSERDDEIEDEEEEEEDEEIDEDEEEDEDDEEEDAASEDFTSEQLADRMTARQRNKLNGTSANIRLIDLAEIEGTNRPKKAQLTADEQRIKRAEMARRRRNLSQQRLEEEKKETLDKLLKKRAKKVRGNSEEVTEESKPQRTRLRPPHPAYSHWTSNKDGLLLSVIDPKRLPSEPSK